MSNKIPCGGFYLDDMLNVNDSGELSIKGGTPYQQLVTDGNGNTQWEDRLAYDATEEQVIFSQEDIAFAERNGLYMSSGFPITAINVGDKLRVDFDSKTYVSTAFAPMPGAPLISIGNGALHHMGDDTGEPFLIQYDIEESNFLIATALTSPTHTVSISRVVETVHMIPQKFLPEKTKVYVLSDDDYMYLDSERMRRLSADDFISAVNSGGIDFIKLPISSEEVHLQMIGYKINKKSGTVIALIARVSDDGSTITVLGRNSASAIGPS